MAVSWRNISLQFASKCKQINVRMLSQVAYSEFVANHFAEWRSALRYIPLYIPICLCYNTLHTVYIFNCIFTVLHTRPTVIGILNLQYIHCNNSKSAQHYHFFVCVRSDFPMRFLAISLT